jgi:hypothetical protein
MSEEQKNLEQQSDSCADAMAGVALVLMFVVVMVFWVSGQ